MQWLTSLGRGGDDGKDEARPGARAAPGGSSLAETRRRVEKLRGYHELAKVGSAVGFLVDLLLLCAVAGIGSGAYGVPHGSKRRCTRDMPVSCLVRAGGEPSTRLSI